MILTLPPARMLRVLRTCGLRAQKSYINDIILYHIMLYHGIVYIV